MQDVVKNPKAVGEWVILEANARKPGQEEKSAMGIILAQKEKAQGEIPLQATVVSVGDECKDYVKALLGATIAVPNGRINNIPDPRVANKSMKKDDPDAKIYIACHYTAIQSIYE